MTKALALRDDQGRVWADARWGCYAFYDYDGEPIYVGQTNESLRTRIRRHLTNQRTDAVAMRILDVFEVAQLEMWPLWDFEAVQRNDAAARAHLNAVEYSAYRKAIRESRFKAILNEKIPPVSATVDLPPSLKVDLVSAANREERGHADIRIARRAETIARLAAVAHERGDVSTGLRRVLVIQAVRLTFLTAERFAAAEGRPGPSVSAIDAVSLLGGESQVLDDEHDRNDEDVNGVDELDETDEVEEGDDGQLRLT
ncbi:GIY-YIG nuclease family protein [Crossiella sp. SN42]|uniref:GIY-YIG nuclease family protein n=1 Tax=Crossiella sp. SN42 TaxID=2944808 RepID=UPI00207D145D|nr:GIY-YIG nuclease family protein [Crossiella sp. SN42]MCO1574888.1 GIY-YIG nuclease family protein [Crossiella sp. SN42]